LLLEYEKLLFQNFLISFGFENSYLKLEILFEFGNLIFELRKLVIRAITNEIIVTVIMTN